MRISRKKFYQEEDYIYGSRSNKYTVADLIKSGKHFVYFASIQNLRGSEQVGGKYVKNDDIYNAKWNCVIVDEAHEGTTTPLGEDVIRALISDDTKLLALSGTPFNILGNYDTNVYTWDYIMEQRCKTEWDNEHFGDSNPYDELPKMNIFVYDLGKLTNNKYVDIQDKAFKFNEFFRVWTGDIRRDFKPIPEGAEVGDFVHADDVRSFLDLITKEDEESQYPYSTDEYRKLFKHSLWMIPGVKEALALQKMMKQHPIFGMFKVVNVAGDGDEEEKADTALNKVLTAIENAGDDGYTITLSCGKLTTGVTVKEWNAVFMLAGSFSTSAANYLQTIFRVQSPCNINGKIKDNCYVFDFAPDRTLKMVAESVALSTKAGKASESDRQIMTDLLNYCPVIAIDGTTMKEYKTNALLQQLKRAYAERAVQNGFDDTNLYNDELLKLTDVDLAEFDKLKGIIGSSKAQQKTNEIDINKQGFTDEEYEELERLEKKPKKERTPEEQQRLEEAKEKKKNRNNAISILRGISIRMPLLIYGADIALDEDFTLDKFLDDKIVDEASWNEFMPDGVTREVFKQFMKYYDQDIFIAAGRRIRSTVKGADDLAPTERVQQIARLFSCFKNPDKETVLTPWRVVNMHMSDCLGGYSFYEENPPVNAHMLEQPRFVDRGKVTADTFSNTKAHILEINSKTGLYPLYVVYSIFRARCADYTEDELTLDKQNELWEQTVRENIFVICKTPMAKFITRRTLVGYRGIPVNAHYFDDLINTMQHKQKTFVERVLKPSYWKREGDKMNFEAVVGNPPYNILDGGNKASATPLYNLFVENSKYLSPSYVSMIIPAKWYSGGRGLDSFRATMLEDTRIEKLFDFTDSNDCFYGVDIAGGVCYFLWNDEYEGKCHFTNFTNGTISKTDRDLNEHKAFIRFSQAVSIIDRVKKCEKEFLNSRVSSQKPFGLRTYVKPLETGDIVLRYNGGKGPYKRDLVTTNAEWIGKWKVIMSYLTNDHAGRADKEGKRKIFSAMEVLPPDTICTETYIVIDVLSDEESATALYKYLCTKFVRFLVSLITSTQHISKSNFAFVPVQDYSSTSDIDWSKTIPEIDAQLCKKYGITNEEFAFIESMIKPMD